jgi:outer membrane receptor protein involved in Fe transport
VRQPSLTELFLGAQTSFAAINDPCHNGLINGGPNPTARRANCRQAVIDAGIAADVAGADAFLAGFVSNAVSATVQGLFSGTPTLRNEEAEAHTVGVVLQPTWLIPNLSIAADYFKIRVDDAIFSVTATQLIQSCFDNPIYVPGSPDCAAVVRNIGGLNPFQINTYTAGFKNIGFINLESGIVSFDYRVPMDYLGLEDLGDVTLSGSWYHLDTNELSTNGTQAGLTINDGEFGDSQDEVALTVNYRKGPFGALVNWNYQSEALWDIQQTSEFRNHPGPGAYSLTNLALHYDVTEQVRARFIVNNVFDHEPPQFTTGTNAIGVYDVMGRRFAFGLQGRF